MYEGTNEQINDKLFNDYLTTLEEGREMGVGGREGKKRKGKGTFLPFSEALSSVRVFSNYHKI